ncbi:MAG: outer membrane beta-barrel protein, partial [Pseudomonadota bacterium]
FRLDVRRNTQVSVDALYDSIVEGRISSGLQDDTTFRPQIERYGGGVQVSQVINRVRGTIGANYTRIDLQSEDGSQNFRDREIGEYGARVEYIVSPSTSLFMRASYARVQYDDPQGTQFDVNGDGVIQNVDIDADGFFASPGDVIEEGLPGIRDNEALRIGVGSVFEISRLLQGEVSIGYLETQYDSPFFNDVDGIDLDIGLTWFATQLTTIRLAGGSSIEDSTIPGSSGFLNYFGQVSVDHELRRNILVSATVAYSEDDYEGIPREDQRIGADIGIDYLMNRNIAVTARYTYQDRDSTDAQIPFTQNIVYLGLRGQI